MPYRKKYNKGRRRGNFKGRQTRKFSKPQARTIRNIARAVAIKTREKKCLYTDLDEQKVSLNYGNGMFAFSGFDAGISSVYCPTVVERGDAANQRDGNSLNPQYFEFEGLMKIDAATATSGRSVLVRLVCGWLQRNEDPSTLLSGEIIRKSGTSASLAGDFKDIYADINWNLVRPIHDKVYELSPLGYLDPSQVGNYVSYANGKPDYRRFKIRHKFGKDAVQNYTKGAPSDGLAMSHNLVCFALVRPMNDDIITTTLNVEFTGVTKFIYTDS